jgi:hypothetical protein
MLTDLDALRLYRLPYLPDDSFTRVLVAAAVQRLSRDYVLIRRTTRLPRPTIIDGFPVVPLDRAVADFALRHADERETVAVAAAAVQKRKVSIEQLSQEARRGPARGRPRLVRVINQLQAGVRSAPEADFRNLVVASRVLPDALWNALLLLPDGTKVSPDALFVGAGLVHEVNSREFHSPEKAGEDVFEDMQRRSDAMVTGGLTVLHNSPNRVANEGRTVISQVETCYQRDAGKGLPPGVVILRAGPPGTPSNVALPPEMAG